MKMVHNQPITGATPRYTTKKNPIVPDAKETSADEERFISEAPTPFKHNMEPNNMPAGKGPRGAIPGPESRSYSGLENTTVGAKALPSGRPVGQMRPINQSGQVNGRMGTRFPRRAGTNEKGFPSKRNARFYGES